MNNDKDFSGQLKTVLVATENGAADPKVTKIASDRTGDALRKAIPPTPLSVTTLKPERPKSE